MHAPDELAGAAAGAARRGAARAAAVPTPATWRSAATSGRGWSRRRCGWFAEQWSEVVSYATDGQGRLDPLSLTGAVEVALPGAMPRPADRDWRDEQRAAVQQVHAAVYRQVAADRVRA